MHWHECNTHNFLFDSEKSNEDFSYTIFPVKKNKRWKSFKIMRKLLFKYSLYSHPEIGNFRCDILGHRGDRDNVGTGNTFPLDRYLKSSIVAPSCNLSWIDYPSSTICCGQGGNQKRWYFVLRVDIRRGLGDLRCGDTQCTDKKIAIR
jgi:hypothetical protein